jgi:hypothetical protein
VRIAVAQTPVVSLFKFHLICEPTVPSGAVSDKGVDVGVDSLNSKMNLSKALAAVLYWGDVVATLPFLEAKAVHPLFRDIDFLY